jgi:hypothetical protein
MTMSIRPSLSIAIFAATLAAAVPASAALITFDDLGSNSIISIPNGYQGYNWDYWYGFNGPDMAPSGYTNGVVSGDYSLCGCATTFSQPSQSISSASTFTLISGYFTSAWNDRATLVVSGFSGATQLFGTSAILDTSGPSFLTFNWSGIDSVVFSISGGTPSGLPGTGDFFALDNLSISKVPEPQSWALMLAGFGLVGATMRRRRAVAAIA